MNFLSPVKGRREAEHTARSQRCWAESCSFPEGKYWHLSFGAEVNTVAVECGRMENPQFKTNPHFKTNPKHSCLPLTYSAMTSNKDHKPKVNMFTQTE